jgi:predicted DNA-binding transcriptional regulator AlpA
MTQPRPETIEREKDKLFLTDAELIRRMGVPENVARQTIDELTNKCGFPQKQKLWGGRRYWPAVKAWFDRTYL